MDSTSIITQVSQEEEQLTSFPPERGLRVVKKPRHKGLLSTLLCCFGANSNNNTPIDKDEHFTRVGQGKCLLPHVQHKDMHRVCLVVDLDETLVHSSFKPINNADFVVPVEIDGTVHQVYVLKRPYVDDFLQKMGELYECILFTASLAKYADPVVDLLDKGRVFRARLFRESCFFYNGNYIKNLGQLGRDLHRVVIVDNSPVSYMFHPKNAVPVASWFGDMSDTELRDLVPFFEQLSKADDVYTALYNSNYASTSHPSPPPPPPLWQNNSAITSSTSSPQLQATSQPS